MTTNTTKEKLIEDCKKCIQSYRERIMLWDEIIPILEGWKTKDGKYKQVDKRLVDHLINKGYKCTITNRTYKELHINSTIYIFCRHGTDQSRYRSFSAINIPDIINSINQDKERLVDEIKKMWSIIDDYNIIERKIMELSDLLDVLSSYKSEAVGRVAAKKGSYLAGRIF